MEGATDIVSQCIASLHPHSANMESSADTVQGSGTLPIELMDRIALETPTVKDLLSLAAVSKAWRRTILPDHLQHQRLSLGYNDVPGWTELAQSPRKAILARHLRIVGPQFLDRIWEQEQITAIEAVAWHFCHLRSLEIKCGDISGLLPFFDNLRLAAPPIKDMKFVGVRLSDAGNTDIECLIIDSLGDFERFFWTCATPLRDQAHLLCAIGRMLNRCPDLVALHISQHDFPTALQTAFDPFWQARMPKLRELCLERILGHELEAEFLHAHTNLELVTHWVDDISEPLRHLPPGSLPKLREARLRCSKPGIYSSMVAPLPDGTSRPIVGIRIALDSFYDINSIIILCRHLRNLNTLIRLELGASDMRADLAGTVTLMGHAAPLVKELSLTPPLHEHPEAVQNWIFAISAFHSLEILRGFLPRIHPTLRPTALTSCFAACPRLKSVDGHVRP